MLTCLLAYLLTARFSSLSLRFGRLISLWMYCRRQKLRFDARSSIFQVLIDTVIRAIIYIEVQVGRNLGFGFPRPAVNIYVLEVPELAQSVPMKHIFSAG